MVKERHGMLAHQRGRKGKGKMNAQIGVSIVEREGWNDSERFDWRNTDLTLDDFRAVRRF